MAVCNLYSCFSKYPELNTKREALRCQLSTLKNSHNENKRKVVTVKKKISLLQNVK